MAPVSHTPSIATATAKVTEYRLLNPITIGHYTLMYAIILLLSGYCIYSVGRQ